MLLNFLPVLFDVGGFRFIVIGVTGLVLLRISSQFKIVLAQEFLSFCKQFLLFFANRLLLIYEVPSIFRLLLVIVVSQTKMVFP